MNNLSLYIYIYIFIYYIFFFPEIDLLNALTFIYYMIQKFKIQNSTLLN